MIIEALAYVSPDCDRDSWVRYLMAIKSAEGEDGRGHAEQWSAQSDKYRPADFNSTWRSISSDGGITEATLYAEAKRNGWTGKPEKTSPIVKTGRNKQRRSEAPPKTRDYAMRLWGKVERSTGQFESRDILVSTHPYAIQKAVTWAAGAARGVACGRLIGKESDCLIIPQWTYPTQELCGVECINSEGLKQTFGNKGVLILGNDLGCELPQLVCEGWATGAHLMKLRNCEVYICGGKGQLLKVQSAIKHQHPTRKVIVMGENDA